MAVGHGKDGSVEISANGSSWTTIGLTTEFSIEPSNDVAESKVQGAESVTRRRGHSSWSANVSYDVDNTDAGQDIIKTAFASDTNYHFRFRPISGSGEQFYGQFVISNRPVRGVATDLNRGTLALMSDGAITNDDQ